MKFTFILLIAYSFPTHVFSSSTPDSSSFYFKQAINLKQERKIAEAERSFQRAVELNPADNDLRFEFGLFLSEQRKYPRALDQFQKVLQVDGQLVKALDKAMEASYYLNRWSDVINYGNRLKGAAASATVKYRLGKAYYEEEDYGLSEKLLREALAQEPAKGDAWMMLGKVFIELSDYKQAVTAYTKALQSDPGNSNMIYEFGLLHYALNNDKEAVKYFELAEQKGYKADLSFKENIGMAYLGFDVEKGVEILNKVLEKKPNDQEIVMQIAQAYYQSKQFQLAANGFDNIYQKDGTNAKALYMVGMCYRKMGDKNKGSSLCDQAIKLDPSLAQLRRLMVGND